MQVKSLKGYTEEELITACQNGERKAQYVLYQMYSRKMMGVCMRYATHEMDAEDMVQDGFVKVFKHIEKYRGDGSFEGWMRRIFVNTAIEHYRRKTPMYPLLDTEQDGQDIVDYSQVNNLNKNDLMNMIQSLSSGYKTIFNLYAVEGYTHKEIGEMLGISEGTSKSQLARARVILQKKLEQLYKVNLNHEAI